MPLFVLAPFLWNGVYTIMLAGILVMLIMQIIRFLLIMHIICLYMSFTKCAIMYYEQKTEPRSTNFCICIRHVQQDTVVCQFSSKSSMSRSWPSFSRSKIWIEYIGKCIREKLSVSRTRMRRSRRTIQITTISKGVGRYGEV